ncbi:DUF6907 domain-containing protein [Streptomyces sp. NBC_01190]|uniref:DUF6907 domain-containing protein n=1 Tax=Streptomyces sp. NBC_01190 TaxID=2903767 RepID=UPI00386F7365
MGCGSRPLDPDGLAEVAAQLRAQADRLDHEIRPQLVAVRADWADRESTRMPLALGLHRASDRGTSEGRPALDPA